MRAAIWLTTAAYVLPLLGLTSRPARAQSVQVLRVIVADFVNKGKYGGDQLAIDATDAVYNELVNSGQSRFNVYGNKEVQNVAKNLKLRVPSVVGQPAYYSRTDLLRIAKEIGADSIVEGEVGTPAPTKSRAGSVQLGVRILDVASQEYINGGFASARAELRPGQAADPEELIGQSVKDAALTVVRQVVQRQQVSATVLQRVGDTIVLNRGLRDGIREGDNLVVIRETKEGGAVKEGILRVARAYATDAEAEVRNETGAIRPEDIARVLYTPDRIISPDGIIRDQPRQVRPINFSLIGSTLAVLGLGVLIAEGGRSGQTSVTGVTAEATTANDGTPQNRITWRDNIFGQAGVLQYHIYRKPDFPYAPNVSGSSGTSGGSTTTSTIAAYPVGVTSGQDHTYYDQQSPYNPFANGLAIVVGTAASATTNSSSSNSSSGTGSGTGSSTSGGGCSSVAPFPLSTTTTTGTYPINVGFTAGRSYTYQVTAVIQRQTSPTSTGSSGTSGGSTGGTTGGGTTGGGTTGGGTTGGGTGSGTSGNNSNLQCIETDPVESGLVTPLQAVTLSAPLTTDRVNLRQFSVSYTTVLGADLYQLEVSTDSRFSNSAQIFRQQFISSTSNSISSQTFPGAGQTPIDLTTQSALLANAAFSAFINGTSTTAPTLYVRVGARHDEDSPGPINPFDPNNSSSSRDFRFVYPVGSVNSLTNVYNGAASSGTGGVPAPPGTKAVRLLNAVSPTRVGGVGGLPLPLPGQSVRGRSAAHGGAAIQAILGGGLRR